jgi:hypothetical protein
MKRRTDNGPRQAPTCSKCRYFRNDPAELEKMFPGILILSSAYGSTRARAGVCDIHERFHDPEPACPEFSPR